MVQRSTDLPAIETEIEHIRSLGLDALRVRWRSIFGATPPMAVSKDLLARMVAYRIQEKTFGGLDRTTIRLLDGMARGQKPGTDVKRRLKAGTVLVREYQGERHTVTVVPGGFVWQGTTYGSLSTIARTITGTPWGGPRFFGLRLRSTAPAASFAWTASNMSRSRIGSCSPRWTSPRWTTSPT